MKTIKFFLTFFVLFLCSSALAQEGEIIYRDFEPDSILIYWHKLGPVWIDLDVDGEADDLMMRMYVNGEICHPGLVSGDFDNTRICIVNPDNIDTPLSEVEEENWIPYFVWNAGDFPGRHNNYGFRIQREDGYCYGWFETYNRYVNSTTAHFGFDRTAYCTIPNYPLMWGQTDLWGVEENEDKASCQLHPNPTTGLVRIEGAEASEVQVFNALGQLVKTVQNTNEVSLEGLLQGVYLLRVRDAEGTVFAKRVIVCR